LKAAALICGRYGGLATAASLVATWALIQSGRTPFASMTTDQRHRRIQARTFASSPTWGVTSGARCRSSISIRQRIGETMSNPAHLLIAERLSRFFGCKKAGAAGCLWRCIREFALILWVVRAPVGVVAFGYLLLGATPQAQDLLVPLVNASPWRVLWFFVLLFVFWAMPVHYSARILICDDARLYAYKQENSSPYLDWLERWIPRLLGAVTFFALVMSAYRANSNLPILRPQDQGVIDEISRNLYYFMLWSVLGLILFLLYTVSRTDLWQLAGPRWTDGATALFRPLLNLLDFGKTNSARQLGADVSSNEFGKLVLIFVFAVFVIVLLARPNEVAELLPGAFALSLILGGWVPILTYLSAIGRRLRAPLITAAVAAIAIITSIVGDNHDVRLMAGRGDPGPIPLDQALTLWTSTNKCTAQDCPRPIIIAASGGASRAGFFTVSLIGELMDKVSLHGLDATELRKRIFAISSVSGSSVGAVMVDAALAAAGPDTREPCRRDRFSDWYGDVIENWRGCLESLMSGDFLTPTFIGLTFHDMVPFGPWRDRATILEQSWERLFSKAMQRGVAGDKELPCPAHLDCPFLSLRPTNDLWLPLLVLNGVSVTTGQRIVTTQLAAKYNASAGCPSGDAPTECRLFAETWLFHEFFNYVAKSEELRAQLQRVVTTEYLFGRRNDDIRLSTAAHNSARFPIISPPGNIRNREHYIVDRIVDGGYMENYGVLAAFELAEAIHAVNPALNPFVLVISNDPEEPIAMEEAPAKVHTTSYATDLTSLVEAVANTRDARGSLAMTQLSNLARRLTPQCKESFAHIRVWPERSDPKSNSCYGNFSTTPRAVSMSWWLSTPVQLRLVGEVENQTTCNAAALEALWKAIPMKSDCVESGSK